MVADVRFKVTMRLRAVIDRMLTEVQTSQDRRKALALAQLQESVAITVRAQYRSRVVREFPGCTVSFTVNRIYVKLPDGYPASNVAVTVAYPSTLRGAFFPRGYNHPRF